MLLNIWATFGRKFVCRNFQKSGHTGPNEHTCRSFADILGLDGALEGVDRLAEGRDDGLHLDKLGGQSLDIFVRRLRSKKYWKKFFLASFEL